MGMDRIIMMAAFKLTDYIAEASVRAVGSAGDVSVGG